VRPGFEAVGHIVPRGAECASGDIVARRGDVVTPALVGALASVGAAHLSLFRRPQVRVLATGSELVPVSDTPGPGRIRNSNAPALAAAAREFGCEVLGEDWAGDDRAELSAAVGRALDADIALITGGVSVGDFDFVPAVLSRAGVRCVFHGVRLQPGKPVWFGVAEPSGAARRQTLVFALPGNPVSTLVNAALFVRPAVAAMLARSAPAEFAAVLGAAVPAGGARRRYVPAVLSADGATRVATPVPFQGSGDLFGFSRADALIIVPEGAAARAAGDAAQVMPLRDVASGPSASGGVR
jgi:molybdopterin molybdotransferase